MKKANEPLASYLTRDELLALLDAPDRSTTSGMRNRAMLHLAFAAALRVSELVTLRMDQLDQQTQASISGHGQRTTRACASAMGRRRLESSKCGSLFGRKLAIQNCSSTPPGTL